MNETRRAVDPTALAALLDMVGGDDAFFDELVDTFLDDAVTQLEALRAAATAGDVEALVRPAHSMKTNSANMGATVLSGLCRDLEAGARSGNLEGAAERVTQAEAEFEAARIELLALRAARS